MQKDIDKFINGKRDLKITSAIKKNDLELVRTYNSDYQELNTIMFIPASGAATRMFKPLYDFLKSDIETKEIKRLLENKEKLPFYQVIKGQGLIKNIIDTYGNKPKALIPLVKSSSLLLPIDNHILEGKQIQKRDRYHFTISREHKQMFQSAIEKYKEKDITYSFQKDTTNTIAVDIDNHPFIDDEGNILYRPAGHGALIENLNDIDADIIFIKNIDNVHHIDFLDENVTEKQKLASLGYSIQKEIFYHLELLSKSDDIKPETIEFIENRLRIKYKAKLTNSSAKSILDRPFRVCGVIKNTGEPGGGPFMVDDGDMISPQICELSELNQSKDKQLIEEAEFFNPVDLVCFVKNKDRQKYNLLNYVKEDRYLITQKSYKGRPLKALELPGLWNGAMHNWNTIFVEVPNITFNPVKTINDVFRKGHQGN